MCYNLGFDLDVEIKICKILMINCAEIFMIHINICANQPNKLFNISKYEIIFNCPFITKVINVHLQNIW